MGNVCSSSDLTSMLLKQYGNSTVLSYAQSIIGGNIIGQQSSTLRNLITQKFNSSGNNNSGMLDLILGQVKQLQNSQKAKLESTKPSIPQLEKASPQVQSNFMSTIQKKFGTELDAFKNKFTTDMTSKFDPSKFLSGGLGNAGDLGKAVNLVF